jgi:glycerol-3-phosphate acyltransferase PlsX
LAKLGYVLARPAFAKLRGQLDPRRYNGAVFLGLQKTVIKSHGRSDAVGTATAIGVAVDMIQYKTIPLMIQRFTEESPLPALPASVPQPQADLVL